MRAIRQWAASAAGLAGVLLLAGCVSNDLGSSSLAWVEIPSHDVETVRTETTRVFAEDSYQLVDEADGRMMFEREATQRDRVMYGRTGEDLAMRVVVSVEPGRLGGFLVRADAYVLRGRHSEPVLRIARRPYQNLLNQVRDSLVNAEPAAAGN